MNELKPTEQQLRAEIEDLKRRLADQEKLHASGAAHPRSAPSRRLLWLLGFSLLVLLVAAFFTGYTPRRQRQQVLAAEAKAEVDSLPLATVTTVIRGPARAHLVLPGNLQPVTEAPVLARANGYLRQRYVDIGDRVKQGQVLAEIEAPELEQQVRQAQATLEQAQSSVQQAEAGLQQGTTNENLARLTAGRWANLVSRGAVSKQENDVYQAQYVAQQANVQALDKAVAAARSNVNAAQANLARLTELRGYQTVRAPFAGVITVRNIDVGALINEGNTLIYRIAQTGRMRTYINVPQSEAESVRIGQTATLEFSELQNRKFTGTVTRTSNALDPATRTLLTEIEVPNADGVLLPGMFTQVDLQMLRKSPPLLIPGDTLVVRADGTQVAVVSPSGEVHYTRIQVGRDYGDRMEVLSGLREGEQVAVNPSDAVREGVKVKPVQQDETTTRRRS
jgi:RND family efflux transporter MFP subunit